MGAPSTEIHETEESVIIQRDGKFYFLDETWNEGGGPFETRAEAEEALERYCSEVLEGIPYEPKQKGS